MHNEPWQSVLVRGALCGQLLSGAFTTPADHKVSFVQGQQMSGCTCRVTYIPMHNQEANVHCPSRDVTSCSRRAASRKDANCSTVWSYPGASFNIACIRSRDNEPRFLSIPSMNYGKTQQRRRYENSIPPSSRHASVPLVAVARSPAVEVPLWKPLQRVR